MSVTSFCFAFFVLLFCKVHFVMVPFNLTTSLLATCFPWTSLWFYLFIWLVVVSGDILAIPPCEGILDAPFGRITSPGYPDVYLHELNCTWSIRRPEQDHIYIYFNDFQLASSSNPHYVKVWYDFCEKQNNLYTLESWL